MRRAATISLRLFAAPIVAALAIASSIAVLLWSTPGRALVSRVATSWISSRVAGAVEIGRLGGNLFDHLTLDGVRITDSLGDEVLRTPHLDLRYALSDLIAGRMVFTAVTIDSARVHMVKLVGGGWNYEAVFHARGNGTPGGAPPLVELHRLQLRAAAIRVEVPTHPGAPRQPVSRHGAAPAQPIIDRGRDTVYRVYTFDQVDARVPLLRLSTPTHLPLLARIASLKAEVGDPRLTLTDFQGDILTAGDTLRFVLDHADLPNTRVRGSGAVRWPLDSLMFDFTLDAERADLADLKWISPDFPDWRGAAHLVAFSPNGTRTEYRLDHLTMGSGTASAAGKLVAIVDNHRGLGVRNLDLALRATPLELMRPYLDTLPFAGTLTGQLTADGFLDALQLGGDLTFRDGLVAGGPLSHLVIDGRVHFGGQDGAVFQDFRLQHSDIALATAHRVSPSVVLPGVMHLDGHLNGPWQNVTFVGTAEHHAPNGAVSRLLGTVRLDTRDTILGVDLDGNLDQLSFDALRTGYPNITARGGVVGHVVATGSLAALAITANLNGDIGTVRAQGKISALSPRFTADSLDLHLERFDLSALMGNDQSTSLNGHLLVSGVLDTLVPPRGRIALELDRSRVGGITFNAAFARLSAASGILAFDTAAVVWTDGRLTAKGTLGWAAPDSGTLAVEGSATALGSLDSLVRATLGMARDTVTPHRLDGTARASFIVSGSRDRMQVNGQVTANDVVLDAWHLQTAQATVSADSLGARALQVDALLDSLSHGDQQIDSLRLHVTGRRDSLLLRGQGRMGSLMARGDGRWVTRPDSTVLAVHSLSLDFPRQQWTLSRPATFVVTDRSTVLRDTVQLVARDGSGMITLAGSIPGSDSGALSASVVALNLTDVYGLLSRDTTVLGGLASFDFRLAGTREAPTLRGSASITGPVSGAVRAPLVHAAFDYQARRLRSSVTFWSTGDPILDVEVSLPLDLALASRDDRRLPGPISITAQADSIDLLVLEALIPGVRNTRGAMQVNFEASGTWDAPRLVGNLALRDAAMTVPALGVRYGGIGGRARFSGDSLVVDSLRLRSGTGDLAINGVVRFQNLANAQLDLGLVASDFLAIDVPNYLRLRPTGSVRLTGPLLQPVLRSSRGDPVELTGSVLYFADLLTKNILDTDDPLLRDLVDTAAIRRQGLGADFQSRFLDSLRIDEITFQIGNDVWLRSSEANVQLEGQVRASKLRKRYTLSGDLSAPRGTYTLKIGGVLPRLFTVESGSVQYQGLPDLSAAQLNIKASHTVRTSEGEDVQIVARITGTIAVPRLDLQSPGRNLTTNEIVSYLAVGRPDLQLGSAQAGQQFLQGAASTLGSEVQQALLAAGLPLDLVEFRPSVQSGVEGGALEQVAVGKQLGAKWFVMANAGICVGSTSSGFSHRNFGASLEYRMTREFRWQASAEPVQSCQSNQVSDVFATLSRYQLGIDLLWTREY